METTITGIQDIVGKPLLVIEKQQGLLLATNLANPFLLERSEGAAKKPYEYFQVFDQNDQPITIRGRDVVMYRTECHGPNRLTGVYHRGANAFIVNASGELLVPLRAADKDLFPSMGDVSVSEHVTVREPYFDAVLRGFREEQGVDIDPQKLRFLMKLPVVDSEQSEMCEYYVCRTDAAKGSEEIASQRWVPLEALMDADIGDVLNFRPDHLPALERFVASYR